MSDIGMMNEFLLSLGFDATTIQRFLSAKLKYSILPKLTDEHVKELLPCIADRITFKEAIEKAFSQVDVTSHNEPLLQKRKNESVPSDAQILKYLEDVIKNSDLDDLNKNIVYESVQSRYPSVCHQKYLIKSTVDSMIMQKKLAAVEDYVEPLSKKLKMVRPDVNGKRSRKELSSEEIEQSPECPAEVNHKTIELFQIGDGNNAILNYVDSDGYMYTKNSSTITTTYLRCKNSVMHSCKARVFFRGNDLAKTYVNKRHNHPSEKKHYDRMMFNKKLEQICRIHPFYTARACYHRTKIALKNTVERKNIPSLKSFESLIFRCQKFTVPPLPKTVDELASLILDPKYDNTYSHSEKGEILFRGIWRGDTGDNVAFVSESCLQEIRKQRHLELLMDGTFKVLPFHIKFRQLYIINVIIEKRCYPLAFILMERKDAKSYELVFEKIKSLISSKFRSIKCMTDYELATRKAIKTVWPEADIHGCYFHYVQAIVKRFKKYGLSRNTSKFRQAMEEICALALLPENFILDGFAVIANRFKKSKSFRRFADYWYKQWGDANISVYGLRNRTNNFAESLNKSINLLIGNKHPHIWRILHNLTLVEMDYADELERVVGGEMITHRTNKEMSRLNRKIVKATKIFEEDRDVKIFLKRVTFNENMQTFFKERIFIDGVDEGDEFDDDESDTVIPNVGRKKANLRRK